MSDIQPIRPARPSGAVFFPLASNAHALIAGSPAATVRSRLKMASILYDALLIEAGDMSIHSGPQGSFSTRTPHRPDEQYGWQTPKDRGAAQAGPFYVSMAPESQPGVQATGPYHPVLQSPTSISWSPTLEPFRHELPADCDWIHFGTPRPGDTAVTDIAAKWKRFDDENSALLHLVPENFVRSLLIDHISLDLAMGAGGGWAISIDRFHSKVLAARFAGDATVEAQGFSLPILVPRVGTLGWEDVAAIRRLQALDRLRKVLREVEEEAFEVAQAGGDLEEAVRRAYDQKLREVVEDDEGVRSITGHGLAEVLLGTAAGYATMGLIVVGPIVGAVAGTAITTAWKVRKIRKQRHDNAWVGAMGAISDHTIERSTTH